MEFSDYMSITALVLSFISVGFSIGFGLYDRLLNIKAKSTFLPAYSDDDGPISPPLLNVEITNYGKRDIYLEYLYIQYGSSRPIVFADTYWESDIHGRYRLGENGKYEQAFDPDSDSILRNNDGEIATHIFFQDSLGRRYFVRNARKNIRDFLNESKNY